MPNPGVQRSVLKLEDDQHIMTLVGGDNLTAARMRGAQRIQGNSEESADQFYGSLPVAEDWHTKECLLEEARVAIHNSVLFPAYVRHAGPTNLQGRLFLEQYNSFDMVGDSTKTLPSHCALKLGRTLIIDFTWGGTNY